MPHRLSRLVPEMRKLDSLIRAWKQTTHLEALLHCGCLPSSDSFGIVFPVTPLLYPWARARALAALMNHLDGRRLAGQV